MSPAPIERRPRQQQRERRLLAEWLARRYPHDRVQQQVRLGAITPTIGTEELTPSELAALGMFRRFADALVYRPDRLVLIEASIPPHPGYISQLLLYRRLVPLTPELVSFHALPVEPVYLVAIEDPVVTALARDAGIRVEVFRPAWVLGYLAERAGRRGRGVGLEAAEG